MSSMNIETSISPNRSSPIKVKGTNQHQEYSYLPTNNNASSSPYVGISFFSRFINKNRLLCLTMTSRRWFLTGICLILIIMSWAIQKETSIILYNSSEEDNDNKAILDAASKSGSGSYSEINQFASISSSSKDLFARPGKNPQTIKIMGTHHKTGTLLLSLVLKDIHKIIHPTPVPQFLPNSKEDKNGRRLMEEDIEDTEDGDLITRMESTILRTINQNILDGQTTTTTTTTTATRAKGQNQNIDQKQNERKRRALFSIGNTNGRFDDDIIMGYFGPLEKQNSKIPFSFRDLRSLYEESENPHKTNSIDIADVFELGTGKNDTKILEGLAYTEENMIIGGDRSLLPIDQDGSINTEYTSYRLVHAVRDPVDVIVSAYLFHKSGPPFYAENWLFEQNNIDHFGKILQPQDDYKIQPSSCSLSKMVETKEKYFLPVLYREKERLEEAIEELKAYKDTDLFLSYRTVGEEKKILTEESISIDNLIEDAKKIIAMGSRRSLNLAEDQNEEKEENQNPPSKHEEEGQSTKRRKNDNIEESISQKVEENQLREQMRLSWFEILNCLDDEEGINAEAEFQTYFGAVSTMYAATDYLNKIFTKKEKQKDGSTLLSSPKEGTKEGDESMILTVKYEHIMENFDESFYNMFDFLGAFTEEELQIIVKASQKHDLSRQNKEELNANVHVTSFKDTNNRIKEQLRELVINYSEKHADFHNRRRTIGYGYSK